KIFFFSSKPLLTTLYALNTIAEFNVSLYLSNSIFNYIFFIYKLIISNIICGDNHCESLFNKLYHIIQQNKTVPPLEVKKGCFISINSLNKLVLAIPRCLIKFNNLLKP